MLRVVAPLVMPMLRVLPVMFRVMPMSRVLQVGWLMVPLVLLLVTVV